MQRINLSGERMPDSLCGVGPGCRITATVVFELESASESAGGAYPGEGGHASISGSVVSLEVENVMGPNGGLNPRIEAIKSLLKPDRLSVSSTGVMG